MHKMKLAIEIIDTATGET